MLTENEKIDELRIEHKKQLWSEIIEMCRVAYTLAQQENPPSFAEVELEIRRGLVEGMTGGESEEV